MVSLSTELRTGDRRLMTVGDVVGLYRDEMSQSVPSRGKIQRIGGNAFSLTCNFKTVDCDCLESVNTLKVYSLSTKIVNDGTKTIDSVMCVSDAHEITEIASATSKNGRYLARLKGSSNSSRDIGSPDGPKKQLLEIWDRSKLLKTIDTTELEAHGSINSDPMFSNFVWSPFGNQDKLLYVCQPKKPKYLSFFKEPKSQPSSPDCEAQGDPRGKKSESTPNDSLTANRGEEYLRKEDWGECLVGIEHTMVAILDASKNCKITTLDLNGYSLGEPQWLDNGNKIVSVAYQETSRKLGLIYCNNRASIIVMHDWQSSLERPVFELGSDDLCFHTPRVNNAGDKFIYLTNAAGGAHKHSMKLHIHDIRTRSTECLTDDAGHALELFVEYLLPSCFSSNDKHILLVTHDHLYNHMCLYSFDNCKLMKIKFPTTGISLLDFQHDIILASGFEMNATPTLFVASINSMDTRDVVAWHQIEDCVQLDEVEYESHEIPTLDKTSFVSALLVKPNLNVLHENFINRASGSKSEILNQQNQLPTVVTVHGGPHASFILSYFPLLVLQARLGLRTLLINYRGSLGVNEQYVQSLCGRVGEIDVDDCMHVIRYFVQNGVLDPSKLIINGGSHGGFIAAHLSCQQEFKFTSAIIKNPVIEVSSLSLTSDIPDWAYTEALGHSKYDFSWNPGSQDLAKMFECSPMSKCQQAYVPTLMLLGNQDRRVPMFQGLRWVDVLKARGVETLCKVYPDKHSLSKVDTYADAFITMIVWIFNHLPQ